MNGSPTVSPFTALSTGTRAKHRKHSTCSMPVPLHSGHVTCTVSQSLGVGLSRGLASGVDQRRDEFAPLRECPSPLFALLGQPDGGDGEEETLARLVRLDDVFLFHEWWEHERPVIEAELRGFL